MTEDEKKVLRRLDRAGCVGICLIVAYDYCCPGLSRSLPTLWNEMIWRDDFLVGCFFGGAVTSLLALAMFLQAKWDAL